LFDPHSWRRPASDCVLSVRVVSARWCGEKRRPTPSSDFLHSYDSPPAPCKNHALKSRRARIRLSCDRDNLFRRFPFSWPPLLDRTYYQLDVDLERSLDEFAPIRYEMTFLPPLPPFPVLLLVVCAFFFQISELYRGAPPSWVSTAMFAPSPPPLSPPFPLLLRRKIP